MLTRREALKRGAALGGTLLWTLPTVQVVGMSRALAQEVSNGCTTYCLRWVVADNEEEQDGWTNNWEPFGDPPVTSNQRCVKCPPGAENGSIPPEVINRLQVSGSPITGFTLTFADDSCQLAPALDPTGDEFYGEGSAAAKCQSGNSCNFYGPIDMIEDESGRPTLEFEPCDRNGQPDITALELILRCC